MAKTGAALVEAFAAAAEKWATARARSEASAARNGLANIRMIAAEEKARDQYEAALRALRDAAQ